MSKNIPFSNPAAQARIQFQQALALHQKGQLHRAQAIYLEILKSQPAHFDCLHLLGVIAFQTGNHRRSAELIGRAIEIYPGSAAFYGNHGNALQELGQLEAAVASYDKAILLKPDYAQAYSNRGSALQGLKRLDSALASYDKAIALAPDYAQAHNNRGSVLQELGQLDDAIASFDKAVSFNPDYAEAHSNRGNALMEHKQPEAAIASFDKAISLDPGYAEAYSNRGNALIELKRPQEAIASFDKAISLKPDYAQAYSNRGNALQDLNELDAAIASFDKAISLKPDLAEAYCNRGSSLHERKQLDLAIASFDKAISLRSDFAEAWRNKSLTLLLGGDLQEGWRLYEWRWGDGRQGGKREFDRPLWLGKEALAGKTLLLHSEQGLGDAIQFCRYAGLAATLGARVILEVPKPLVSLFKILDGVSEIVETGAGLPDFDYHCPLLSLPLAFKTDRNSIPAPQAYLRSDTDKRGIWADRLGVKSGLRVGLAWNGSAAHKKDHNRSIALSRLLAHLPQAREYISLQKELRETDRAALEEQGRVRHFGEALTDFADTAALCDLMDVVVSVDTSAAHLAGALGKTSYVMLPYVPDWRWLLEGSQSAWYPSLRLYRQPAMGDWSSVLERVASDLEQLKT